MVMSVPYCQPLSALFSEWPWPLCGQAEARSLYVMTMIGVGEEGGFRVYASIRQAKAKTGMAEELARRIKVGAIPIISDVEGFMAYYLVYAPDDTVTAISIFNDYAGAEESNRRVLAWIEQSLTPLLAGPATAMARSRRNNRHGV
jgi:hypothetical protein